MNRGFQKLYVTLHNWSSSEEAQDLVEYALLLTMISLALITAIGGIATAVTKVFTNISSSLA